MKKARSPVDTSSVAGVWSNTEMGPEDAAQSSFPEGTRWACRVPSRDVDFSELG